MALSTWRLTGRVLNPAGQAVAATLTLRPIPAVVHDPTDGDVTASVVRLSTRVAGDPVLAGTELPADLVTADGLHYVLSVEPRLWPAMTFAAPTAGATLALDDIVPSIPTPIPTVDAATLRAEWQAAIAAIEPSTGVSEAVVSPTQGTVSLTPVHGCTHTLALTGDAEITLDPAPGGTIATLAVTYAGHALTVDGTTWTATVLVLHRYAGVWHITAAGESVTTPIPDTMPPTAGALSASAVTASGATLTVTDASDETAMHATAYSFSLDGGATWLPWQAGSTYAAALSASTTYTPTHRVRDAAGNITVGTPIEVTTPAASDTTAPTAPTLAVDATSQTQLVATVTGGTDAVGVTQRRVRLDGGAWEVLTVATTKTYSGLTAGSAHTIDAQAGDAAGNWSTSASWSGSTAAAPATLAPDEVAGLYAWYDLSDAARLTVSGAQVTAIASKPRGALASTVSGAGTLLDSVMAGVVTGATVNGRDAVTFPAGKTAKNLNHLGGVIVGPDVTFIAVYRVAADVDPIAGWAVVDASGNGIGGYSDWRIDGPGSYVFPGGTGAINTTPGVTYVHAGVLSGSTDSTTLARTGITTTTAATATNPNALYWITVGGAAALTICEIAYYTSALTGDELTKVMAGLANKWGA